jgi:hypothetical protein
MLSFSNTLKCHFSAAHPLAFNVYTRVGFASSFLRHAALSGGTPP